MSKEQVIDFERTYTPAQTADKLSRIAEAIEAGESFRIQVGGHHLRVPTDGEIEMQTNGDGKGEIELEIKWNRNKVN